MVKTQKESHKELLEQSIKHLEHLGYEKIKADTEGFETPKSFHKKGSDILVTPDITAYIRSKKYYFELGVKSDKVKLLKSKWRFLDVLSRMKTNDLNLDKNLIKYSYKKSAFSALLLFE